MAEIFTPKFKLAPPSWEKSRKILGLNPVKTGWREKNLIGKLALKYEAAGKIRVFALVDPWTQ
jgi:hypothetical protein